MSINLGDRVKDCVTGVEGIAVGRTIWITGCNQIIVQPGVFKDGKLSDSLYFDETRLEVIEAGATKVPGAEKTIDRGGPHPGY